MKMLKLGGLLLAAMAVMAIGASAASAGKYAAASYPVSVEASQVGEHVFTVDGQQVKCSTADFVSESETEAVEELTILPTYEGCKAFGFVNATVKMNGCHFVFTAPTSTGGKTWHSIVHVICTSEAQIEINASTAFGTCEVRVGAQEVTEGEHMYTNEEDGTVFIETELTGIDANVVKDTGICPLSGTGPRTNSTYTGDSSAEGDSGQDIFIE